MKRLLLLVFFYAIPSTYALDQIIRPYQSTRSAGMGGVRMTTGIYDENFFNNPARVTANPNSKLTLIQISPVETNTSLIQSISSISSGNDALATVANSAGSNQHGRFQIIMPAYYLAANEERKSAFAVGLIGGFQADAGIRQSYQANLGGILDWGPAVTYGRKFLPYDALSVGVTGHVTHRFATEPSFSLADFVKGRSLGVNSIGTEGTLVDFDIGTTYQLPYKFGHYDIAFSAAIQNALGGNYSHNFISIAKINTKPPQQPRSFGFGASIHRDTWFYFTDSVLAVEMTDIGNNPNGSIFKLIHIGTSTHFKLLEFRAGLNQGYWALGVGIDLKLFHLDAASYGEEMGLNAGMLEDRRYALGFSVEI